MRNVLILVGSALFLGCVVDAPLSNEPIYLEPSVAESSDQPSQSSSSPNSWRPDQPLIPPADEPNAANCRFEMGWAKTSPHIFSHRGFVSGGFQLLMPNHPVVVGSAVSETDHFDDAPLVAYRLSDGEPIFEIESTNFFGVYDDDWSIRAEFLASESGQSLVVRPMLDAPEFWRMEIDRNRFNHALRFGPNGRSLFLSDCHETESEGEDAVFDTQIRQFGAVNGDLQSSVTIPNFCPSNFGVDMGIVAISKDNRYLLLGSTRRYWNSIDPSELYLVDMRTQTFEKVAETAPPVPLINFALTPDGSQLFATQMDGQMRRWSFPEMAPMENFVEVGIFSLGRRTYMPTDDSPIAFSRSGAYIDTTMDVVVARVEDGEIVHRIELTRFLNDELMHNGNTGAEAVQLAFTEDGVGLVVGLTSGLAVYRCEGTEFPTGRDNLSILLDGPSFLSLGETATLTATHVDATHMHGHAFYVNGHLISTPSTARHAQWTPDAAGVYEITVRLIDGVNTGEATMFIEVTDR